MYVYQWAQHIGVLNLIETDDQVLERLEISNLRHKCDKKL